MAKFLTGNALNSELEKIFREAEEELIIISPFIKLHPRFRDILNRYKENPKVLIKVLFGKNEGDIAKSISIDEINYFIAFPNIEIRYEARLHAKYYANENNALLSSMNLYQYSQDNNIEVGVLTENNLFKNFANSVTGKSVDQEAYNYFEEEVFPNSQLLFEKKPEFDKGVLRTGLNKKYTGSNVITDKLYDFFGINSYNSNQPYSSKISVVGYCIRTGVEIPFDPSRPMSYEAYKKWTQFNNPDYPEKFCHKTGKSSNGKTSMRKPIMFNN